MKALFAITGIFVLFSLSGFEIKSVKPDGKTVMSQIDSPYFKAIVNHVGGRFYSIYSKVLKSELTDEKEGGSGTENVWNVGSSRFFLRGKPFTVTPTKLADRLIFKVSGNHQGGGINFLRSTKEYIFWKNSSRITIKYDLENIAEAMAPVSYGFWIHHMIGEPNAKSIYYYPTTEGITRILPEKRPTDTWQFRPARGWLGSADPVTGRGAALTMSYPEIKCLYTWFAGCKVPTTEWRTELMSIDAGKSFNTVAEILPFTGLKKISGAGGGLVGELRGTDIETEKGSVDFEVRVHNTSAGKIEAEVMVRQAPSGKWKSVKKAVLNFKKPATVESFKCSVKGEEETLQEIEVILRRGKKELARLNGFVNFDGSEEKWSITPLEEKRIDARNKVDLLRFNKVNPTPHVKWASPLPGGKIKTLVLTHSDSILENGELAQRLDMDFTIPFLFNSEGKIKIGPSWRLGDYAGMLSSADIDRELERALKADYQLIIVGGLPWTYFTNKLQRLIAAKVKNGAGLIYIGPSKAADWMPIAASSVKRQLKGIPAAAKKSPVTSGVPFELFTSEPVQPFKAAAANVLAKVKNLPYLVSGRYGKGKIYVLTYHASFGRFGACGGFTPNFAPKYPDRVAPFEYHYSLIAKLALDAANRNSGVTADAKFQKGRVRLDISSPKAQHVTIALTGRDAFRNELFTRQVKVSLKKGMQSINVPLPLASHARKQVLDVIIRDAKGSSLNWGSWSYNVKAPARIAAVKVDKKYYRDGESVKYNVELKGNPRGISVKAEYVDTYGRIFPVGSTLTGSFKLTNALCSRLATLRVRIFSGKKEIDRMERSFPMIPAPEVRKWQDFEIGTWLSSDGPRSHVWPLFARIMKSYLIDTGIANWSVMQVTYPIHHNIHPTMLEHLGITRCPEPLEYAKTGNKLVLKRRPCLSDPAFVKKMQNTFRKLAVSNKPYALRFYWMGDEQSITGYGGAPTDFCFSDHCIAYFREFLKKKYGTLKVLNSEWNTSFKKWEDVLPFTKDEIWNGKEKSVAGWADHLEFMDGRLENMASTLFKILRKHDPNTRTSISGTQPPTAYGGMDWGRLMKHFDGLMNYDIGGQFELQRSFNPDAELAPWLLGYSRHGGIVGFNTWKGLFVGMRGVFGFCYPSMVNPDGTPAPQMKSAIRHLKNIRSGIGLHWINNLSEKADIAVLYSQSSIRAAFIEKRHRTRKNVFEKWDGILRNCGYNFKYITSEQLEQGVLGKDKYRVLILPDCGAMSDKEIAEVRRFAKAGGILIADGIPARRYANCRMRKAPALADCFKLKGNLLKTDLNYKYLDAISFYDNPANAALLTAEQAELRKVLGGNAAPVITCGGKPVIESEIYVRQDRAGNVYTGIVTPAGKQRAVTLTLPEAGYVYDLISGRSYGRKSRVEVPVFVNAQPILLAVFKAEVALAGAELKGSTVNVRMNSPVDTAAHIRVFAPDGEEVTHYSRAILLKGGKGSYTVPFAPSDAGGRWKIQVTEVITKKSVTIDCKR